MIPVLTTMVGLLILLVAMDVIVRDQERGGEALSAMAGLIIAAAVAGTAYTWYLSAEAQRQMEEANQRIEQIQQMWP